MLALSPCESTGSAREVVLAGCHPEPLLSYLKALGVLRLVGQQVDSHARGCWRDETFVLRSTLAREDLVVFFLESYQPTPILSPWNSAGGFLGTGEDRRVVERMAATDDPRLAAYRETISRTRGIIDDLLPAGAKLTGEQKGVLVARCRAQWSDRAVEWLDAAIVLRSVQDLKFPPLLGSGGNDGRLEFSVNLMGRHLPLVLPRAFKESRSAPSAATRTFLADALFGGSRAALVSQPIGQFDPGGAGGANLSQAFESGPLVNPWDYVLALEGALLFAGAAVRRLDPRARDASAFPFTVEPSAAGYGTAVEGEYQGKARGEIWLPIWDRPATLPELRVLFAEGRLQLGRRQARNGIEVARAIAALGIERGIASFRRYAFLERRGRAFVAVPLGRLDVRFRPRLRLLDELDPWLDQAERAARGEQATGTLIEARNLLHRETLTSCQDDSPRHMQDVLIAYGRLARTIGSSAKLHSDVGPLPRLNPEWLAASDDGSPTFALAAAIASIRGIEGESGNDRGRSIGRIRGDLEPVDIDKRGCPTWAPAEASAIIRATRPLDLLVDLLARRILAVDQEGLAHLPLAADWPVGLDQIAAFLDGRIDDARLIELLFPLSCIDWSKVAAPARSAHTPTTFSRAYALLKLLFLPKGIAQTGQGETIEIPLERSILPLLRARRTAEALEVTCRRLSVSGIKPASSDYVAPPALGPRLAAALVIPVANVAELVRLVTAPSTASGGATHYN